MMLRTWTYRKLLPAVMTAVQLVLLALSMAQQWRLPTNPSELHRKYPPAGLAKSYGVATETFELRPEPKTSTLFKVATALSLPAVFSGAVIGLPFVALGLRGSESLWIGMSMPLGFVMWRQIGRWIDEQCSISTGTFPARSKWRFAFQWVLRFLAFSFLLLFVLSVMIVRHLTVEAEFLAWSWIVWAGGYLVLSFWGENRQAERARAVASVPASGTP